ncbi:MAG: hypothetical protein QM496_07910 [Verrucomicrobiota bacterium]
MTILVATFIFAALPQTAQAGHSVHRRIHHTCTTCHSPVYSYRSISHYNSHGHPFYRWSIRSHSHHSSGHGYGGGYGHGSGHGYSHGYRHGYGHSYGHGYSRHRPRVGFSFSFGHH